MHEIYISILLSRFAYIERGIKAFSMNNFLKEYPKSKGRVELKNKK